MDEGEIGVANRKEIGIGLEWYILKLLGVAIFADLGLGSGV